jgi:hypothetical protein
MFKIEQIVTDFLGWARGLSFLFFTELFGKNKGKVLVGFV